MNLMFPFDAASNKYLPELMQVKCSQLSALNYVCLELKWEETPAESDNIIDTKLGNISPTFYSKLIILLRAFIDVLLK